MATTTTSADAHREAQEDRGRKQTLLADARAREAELLRMLARNDDAPTPDRRDQLRARREVFELQERLIELELAAVEAERREAEAREAMKAEADAAAHERRRAIVSKLARALLAARPHADALSELHVEAAFGDAILWPALQSRTPTFESQLTHWLVTVAAYDLLDPETLKLVRQSEAGGLLPTG
jgi:hypothetical protein